MIVGCKDVDFSDLKSACRSEASLLRFAVSIVPSPLQHIPAIIDNQKYFIALQVRSIQSLTWKKKKALCESLLQGVYVKGVPDSLYDYNDILMAIDRDAFEVYLKEEAARSAEG